MHVKILRKKAASEFGFLSAFRFHFAPADGLVPAIAAMIDAERQCCRFLRFSLTAEPGEGSLTLDVTGPAGTADFLAPWVPAP